MTDKSADDLDVVALEQLVLEDTKLAEDEERIKARRATIRSVLARHLDAGTTDLADHQVIVTRPLRLTAEGKARFEQAYPVTQHPEFYRPEIQRDVVEEKLSPEEWKSFKTPGAKQVTIR